MRVPERLEVPMSKGTPTKATSRPWAVGAAGRRIMVPGPPKRGIALPPSGWLKSVMASPLQSRRRMRLPSTLER